MRNASASMADTSRLEDWQAEPPYDDRKSLLVLILRGLNQMLIEKAFAMFCGALIAEGRVS